MTLDLYLKQQRGKRGLLISDMGFGLENNKSALIPAISWSLESPIVATRYYHYIGARTASFYKVYDWHGVAERIKNPQTRFIANAWPTSTVYDLNRPQWNRRKFLILVNGNKRAFKWLWPDNSCSMARWTRAILGNFHTSFIRTMDPWMKSELYLERLMAIRFFAGKVGFDLFGLGWDQYKSGEKRFFSDAIKTCWRGSLNYAEKKERLSQYQFCLCYENTVFPGYLTEKIFDCFFSGVIPIYLGDPDIQKRIPQKAFIDRRKFSSYDELYEHLCGITEKTALTYLDSAKEFLMSQEFQTFTSNHFSQTFISVLNKLNER
jgi:hypothetical protein